MSSIRLHEKYGVNPTIPTCFWCGKDRNEVALLGAAYKGEAPMHMVIDYDPCDECRANMDRGVVVIEMATEPTVKGQPAINPKRPGAWHDNPSQYPTGRWTVVKAESEFGQNVVAKTGGRQAAMLPVEYEKIFGKEALEKLSAGENSTDGGPAVAGEVAKSETRPVSDVSDKPDRS